MILAGFQAGDVFSVAHFYVECVCMDSGDLRAPEMLEQLLLKTRLL